MPKKSSNNNTFTLTLDPAFVAAALECKPPHMERVSNEIYLSYYIAQGDYTGYQKKLRDVNEQCKQMYANLGLDILPAEKKVQAPKIDKKPAAPEATKPDAAPKPK